MRKLKFFLAGALLAVCAAFGCGAPLPADAAETEYYLGGMTAGFSLSANGVEIIAFKEIRTAGGSRCPASDAGMKTGDVIVAVDGLHTRTVEELGDALARANGNASEFLVRRGKESLQFTLTPIRDDKVEKFKIGILIRDTLSGIGTVTYIEKESGRFGALGHAVCDENKNSFRLADACVYRCSIIGVTRGERGRAGELRGFLLNDMPIAQADNVCGTGLYGTFESGYDFSELQTVTAAPMSEATIGKAVIYSTIDGVEPKPYEIAIAKVDPGNRNNKNFVIKVTDDTLLRETGGIVQGMSGGFIIQNGKVIGEVTDVFLNDPTGGYGIGIEKMLGN